MGYTTEFEGVLRFTKPLTIEELVYLESFLDEHPDNHPEWLKPDSRYGYIQYQVNKDKTGIEWDQEEKFYYSVEAVNLIIANMRNKFPEFGLEGFLRAQGEDISDCWLLKIVNGVAVKEELPQPGDSIVCPNCNHEFPL